jgi:glycosyltransferase involved in cell wall biosynthesis
VPVLVHAPSHLAAKGTPFVREAVERLKARGLAFEYVELHGVTHDEALAGYRRADLVVDQLCTGYHGVVAVEAMALAKPVVCYTLPELEPTYPRGYPLINANPDTVTAVLEEWLQRPGERHARGLASREYAERVHDHRAVAARLLDAYDRIARGGAPAGAGT